MEEEQQLKYPTYMTGGVTRPCKYCRKPVEVSPGNGSWISSGVTCLTKVEFTIVAHCHSCGKKNYYINFMDKSKLRKTEGAEEV